MVNDLFIRANIRQDQSTHIAVLYKKKKAEDTHRRIKIHKNEHPWQNTKRKTLHKVPKN